MSYISSVKRIFVSGGTGYIGSAVIPHLLDEGHEVTALARRGSERKLPLGVEIKFGNALDESTFSCNGSDTFIHLIGTPHPAPWKAAQFRAVDLPALRASVAVAVQAAVKHFIFLSVAQPAPVMKAYLDVRAECEDIIRDADLIATIVRPWYVLGPGHRWPGALKPAYWLAERVPTLREGARRLGLVTLEQIVGALVWAANHPPAETRVLGVPEIRRCA
jgi:uncharacterized protein YbjT (DUF2867 family)